MKKLLISLGVIGLFTSGTFYNAPTPKPCSPAQRMHDAIVLYADSFGVPLHIAFNMAYLETTYRGPQDSTYNHKKTSSCGAVGPMQIMPRYASHYAGFKVTKQQLRDSIELNVMISMKIMASNFKKTKSWKKAAGKYHTGKPCVDWYAKKAVLKQFYQEKWI
jgi:soluble lytic murein transglycosylase-like protein